MSSISFTVSPENLIPQGRTEQLPQFVANPPTPKKGVLRIQVIPPTPSEDFTWTTGSIVTQPR
jgi:hypothetical protein